MVKRNQLKVRKVGNSLGAIIPKNWEVSEGDILHYEVSQNKIIIDRYESDLEHDRRVIDEGFKDFEKGLIVDNERLKKEFGKYGWK